MGTHLDESGRRVQSLPPTVVRLAAPRLVDGAESLHKIEVLARLQPAHNEDLKVERVRGGSEGAMRAVPSQR